MSILFDIGENQRALHLLDVGGPCRAKRKTTPNGEAIKRVSLTLGKNWRSRAAKRFAHGDLPAKWKIVLKLNPALLDE